LYDNYAKIFKQMVNNSSMLDIQTIKKEIQALKTLFLKVTEIILVLM